MTESGSMQSGLMLSGKDEREGHFRFAIPVFWSNGF